MDTMDARRIKIRLLLEGQKPCYIFQRLSRKNWLKPVFPVQHFIARFYNLGGGWARQALETNLGQGDPLRQ